MLERSIKKEGIFYSTNSAKRCKKIKWRALLELLELLFVRITKDETELIFEVMKVETEFLRVQMTEYSKMMMFYIFELRSRDVPLDPSKLPDALEAGWSTFKVFWRASDKNERKRVTLKSFDDCLQEKTMEELCQSFAELRKTKRHTL